MTSEQLEAARAERMRQNGLGTLSLEDARTWIEETGLCLFLPRRQFSSSVAPSFVEAIAGRRNVTPEPNEIQLAEEILVRLELAGVAVRLNLQGQPGEQPDFVVASWVLPYVYALKGDRDWRRIPQLTGSRAVSPLAVQAYKLLEANESSIAQLKHALGREVSEAAVVRAITELWQQLRIIPVIAEPGRAAKWQLLRVRYQKAIAEGASTSQVTAISVLASIYLQAVIAASMEEVEIFLSPLTARSKVREVLRGLVATRQVHTISMGHAPHFYVAGTLPEFAPPTSFYGGNAVSSTSSYYASAFTREEPVFAQPPAFPPEPAAAPSDATPTARVESHAPRTPVRKPAAASKSARPRFSRPAPHNRDRKPSASRSGASTGGNRTARRASDARPSGGNSHNSSAARNGQSSHSANGKSTASNWSRRNGLAHNGKAGAKAGTNARNGDHGHKIERTEARSNRKTTLAASAKAGNSKRFGFTARPKQGSKKRG